MSEAVKPEAPQGAEVQPTPAEPAPAQETDWKAEARKWEGRAKENATAAQRLAELEEAQKTEIQKAQERAERAEAALAAKEVEAIRFKVAAAHGLPADLLTGTTEEELEASAKALIAFRGEQKPQEPARFVVPELGKNSNVPLNGSPLEDALKKKLGIA